MFFPPSLVTYENICKIKKAINDRAFINCLTFIPSKLNEALYLVAALHLNPGTDLMTVI